MPEQRPWQSRPLNLSERRLTDAAPLYRAAFEEAKLGVTAQTVELDSLRQRAGTYMSFVGAATAFLVGTGLTHGGTRDWVFYTLAIAASAFSLATLILACCVLLPAGKWEQKLSGQDLVEGWIETDVPPTETLYFRALALLYDEMGARNEEILERVRRLLAGVVSFGSLQVLAWTTLAWMNG